MTQAVWKYPLEIKTWQNVRMPIGATIIHAALQDEDIFLWAVVDTENVEDDRLIGIFATGQPMPNQNLHHLGTVMPLGGALVFHVFEDRP